ncbi:DUF5930 domain-containing protein [Paracoccus panacisoli]|uniref:DUF5930 domain-containing protein n=1 Tax=Paracoccus panacisoli TaxID=1510163 RepID=A0ABV6T720_9RHOB
MGRRHLTLRPIRGLRTLVGCVLPERRLFIRSGDHVRFVRLSPGRQALAWAGGAFLVAWCLTVTSVLIMNSIDFLTMREQAKREQALFEDRALALGGERDQQAMEALAAQERFAAATVQMSSMQSDLLALETRRREMESELQAAQATLRRTMDARAAAVSASQDPRSEELAATLDLLTLALTETVVERDQAATKAKEAVLLAGELEFDLRLRKSESNRILLQIEEALIASVEPLDEVLREAGLDSEAVLASAGDGHSAPKEALVPLAVSTRGIASLDDETVRANRILERLDELSHYRLALESLPLAMPVQDAFRYTSPFGRRWGQMHKGVDMAGPVGTPVYATADGVVTFAGWQNGYGRIIIVRHPFGLETRYPHLNAIRVEVGQEVARGERVGDMGNSGRSTGSHLHYEVRVNGEAVDPMGYIRAGRDLL